jgi:hypothetical protein
VLFLPGTWAVISPGGHPAADRATLSHLLFIPIGTIAALFGLWAAWASVIRGNGRWRTLSIHSQILLGWLMLEVLSYFVLSPFPAARRVLSLTFVGTLIVLRLYLRLQRLRPLRWGQPWMLAVAFTIGTVVAAIDAWDAAVEPCLAQQAVAIAKHRIGTGRGYTIGHWGFQYAMDREGVALIVPGETQLQHGDWVVLPMYPDDVGFYRPYHGEANVRPDVAFLEPVAELVWQDLLAAQTVPNLYGGKVPIVSRKHPRLRLTIYKVLHEWTPPRQAP